MFSIGQIFIDSYPAKAAEWCNVTQQAFIHEIEQDEEGHRRFIIEAASQPELSEQKKIRLELVNSAYENAVSSLVSTYPITELLTFDKQEQEARAWQADNTVSTPLIDALAQGRDMDKSELVSRIIAKADVFAVATGYLTGQRQKYEDQIDAAATAEEVAAIVTEYVMPQGLDL